MGKRAEALELARFLAFDGQDAEQIARALEAECGLGERDAARMALNVLAPSPEPPLPAADLYDDIAPPPY